VVEVVKGVGGTGCIEGNDQLGMGLVAEEEYCKAVAMRVLIWRFVAAKVHEVHCFQAFEEQNFGEVEAVRRLVKQPVVLGDC
jgi:hypothetical protein